MTRLQILALDLGARFFGALADLFEAAHERLARCPKCGRNLYGGKSCVDEDKAEEPWGE